MDQKNRQAVTMVTFNHPCRHYSLGGRGGATHSHVWSAARVSGFGDGVHQLTADAKVAQLYVAVPVQEDVGRLDVYEGEKTEA